MKGKGITSKGPTLSGLGAGRSKAKELNSSSEKRTAKGGNRVTGSKGIGDNYSKGKKR
jgi:hypothetical protein